MGMLEKVMYRMLLREAGCGYQSGRRASLRVFSKKAKIPVVDPIAPGSFGTGQHEDAFPSIVDRVYRWSAPGTVQLQFVSDWAASLGHKEATDVCVSRKDLIRLIRLEFEGQKVQSHEITEKVSKAIRVLNRFMKTAECTTFSEGNGVLIELSSSNPWTGNFFLYRLRILSGTDGLNSTIRLLGRHWSFRNSEDKEDACVERFGEGVLGMRPTLSNYTQPEGKIFEYVSGSDISTETGSMEGALLFENIETGDRFEVPIQRTRLIP